MVLRKWNQYQPCANSQPTSWKIASQGKRRSSWECNHGSHWTPPTPYRLSLNCSTMPSAHCTLCQQVQLLVARPSQNVTYQIRQWTIIFGGLLYYCSKLYYKVLCPVRFALTVPGIISTLELYQSLYYSNHIGVAHSPQNILDEQWTPYICTLYL